MGYAARHGRGSVEGSEATAGESDAASREHVGWGRSFLAAVVWVVGVLLAAVLLVVSLTSGTPAPAGPGWVEVPAEVTASAPASSSLPSSLAPVRVEVRYVFGERVLLASFDRLLPPGEVLRVAVDPVDPSRVADPEGRVAALALRALAVGFLVALALLAFIASRRSSARRGRVPGQLQPDGVSPDEVSPAAEPVSAELASPAAGEVAS